jgi:predicted flap endonuclease-1-like 5' DNA nuclease
MLIDQAFAPALFLQQDTAGISPIILGIIAILLVALFIWLLLREPKASKVAVEKPAEVVKPIDTVPSEPAGAPFPKDETVADETNKVYLPIVDRAEPTPVPVVEPEPAVEAAVPVATAPALQPESAVVEAVAPIPVAPIPDDLEIIEGIGPKISGVLRQAGVITFSQLAAMEPARITEILHAANMRLADPKTWPEQARLAAAGDQAGLQALQGRLKGGREV